MGEEPMHVLAHEKQIAEVAKMIEQAKEQGEKSLWTEEEVAALEQKLEKLKAQVLRNLSAWERVTISRHPSRPRSHDFIKNLCEEFEEIHGDRLYRDDPAIIAGFGKIGGEKFMIIAQEKGCDTESRLKRNFGMPHPEGYRKALRCMQLAAKFRIPVISFLDTPGAYPGLAAEERGQGWAIARNLLEMAHLPTPMIIILIGEGCSGGALGMGMGDRIGMLRHAYYSVISPEGCASILWQEKAKNEQAATALRMQAEDMIEFGVVDEIIEEPAGGAHLEPKAVYQNTKAFIARAYAEIRDLPIDQLLEQRYEKFRSIGVFAEELPLLV